MAQDSLKSHYFVLNSRHLFSDCALVTSLVHGKFESRTRPCIFYTFCQAHMAISNFNCWWKRLASCESVLPRASKDSLSYYARHPKRKGKRATQQFTLNNDSQSEEWRCRRTKWVNSMMFIGWKGGNEKKKERCN